MDIESARHGGLDFVEEFAELGGTVASIAPADDPSGCDVESGEQRSGAVPFVVMASPSWLAGTHRQHRLTAVQRLDLRLLIYTQNDGALRRRDVKAHDIAHLGHEVRIGRELERLHPMRLEPEGPPDALHRRYRQAAGLRHAAGTPMGSVLGAPHQFPYE